MPRHRGTASEHDKIGRLLFAQGCNVTASDPWSTFYTGRAAPPGAALPSHFLGQQDAGNRRATRCADTLPGRPQNSKDAPDGCAARASTASSRAQRARAGGQARQAPSLSSNSPSGAAATNTLRDC